jgi:hypothetical protein
MQWRIESLELLNKMFEKFTPWIITSILALPTSYDLLRLLKQSSHTYYFCSFETKWEMEAFTSAFEHVQMTL